MFCPKCGSQVHEGSKFCGTCGALLSANAASKQAVPATFAAVGANASQGFSGAATTVAPTAAPAQQAASNPRSAAARTVSATPSFTTVTSATAPRYAAAGAPANPYFAGATPAFATAGAGVNAGYAAASPYYATVANTAAPAKSTTNGNLANLGAKPYAKIAIVVSIVGFIAFFMDLITVSYLGQSSTVTGMNLLTGLKMLGTNYGSYPGLIVCALPYAGALVATLALKPNTTRILHIVCGILGLLVCAGINYTISSMSGAISSDAVTALVAGFTGTGVSAGIGLHLMFIAAIVLIVVGFLAKKKN